MTPRPIRSNPALLPLARGATSRLRFRPRLNLYGVAWRRSLLSTDRLRMVCEYEAPSHVGCTPAHAKPRWCLLPTELTAASPVAKALLSKDQLECWCARQLFDVVERVLLDTPCSIRRDQADLTLSRHQYAVCWGITVNLRRQHLMRPELTLWRIIIGTGGRRVRQEKRWSGMAGFAPARAAKRDLRLRIQCLDH
jgi:hypothetical protein